MKRVTYLVLTVDQLTDRISSVFMGEPSFQNLAVRGEIIEMTRHGSGNVFFALSGDESRIACVLFKSDAQRVPLWPRTGDEVIAEGRVAVYGQRGIYQIYARRLSPVGAGAAARAREELKRRLQDEGVFSPELKRPLPEYPCRVVVVTSPTGAAVHDVIRVAGNRFPCCELIIVPVTVQGYEAASSVPEGIFRANLVENAEALLLVRGGGSRDDMNPFDDENIVRAVRASRLPVVTGLGHDIDVSLSDLAADVAAATPSAAADLLFPDIQEIRSTLRRTIRLASSRLQMVFQRHVHRLERLSGRLRDLHEKRVREQSQTLQLRRTLLDSRIARALARESSRLSVMHAGLLSLSPLRVLSRGYCICETEEHRRIRSLSEIRPGERILLRFVDGSVRATTDPRTEPEV